MADLVPFLESLVAAPTVLFTGALGLALLYWCMVFLGALDIELLDFDADFELDVDGAVDGALDGVEMGEAAEGLELEPSGGDSALAFVIGAVRVKNVPMTVTLSFIALAGWAACWLLAHFLLGTLSALLGVTLATVGVGVAAAGAALPVGRLATTPFSGLFHTEEGTRRGDLIGQTVRVLTGKVTDTFGQGELTQAGTHFVVEIRCDAARGLARDAEALLVSWDPEADAFVAEPLDA